MERRLTAILAADVVGYSRLMEADETATLESLKAHRTEFIDPTIAEHRGRIVKLMGDGILAEFASVVNAVLCAVELQRGLAVRNAEVAETGRIVFRIGINLGDVIAEGADIYGDGVNIAARLESLAEPGGLCISQQAFDQVATKLDLAFEDLGEHQVKNITRPIRVWRWSEAPSEEKPVAPAGSEALPVSDKPSIAVLPLTNMSGDPEQEYFSDGIAEDITTALSRFHELTVIARNTSFTFKGQAVNVRKMSRDLGVKYVLQGSVRRAGKRVRVSVQLIDATIDKHIWAERYDRDLDDIFAVQDEITDRVVSAVAPETQHAEMLSAYQKDALDLTSWERVMRARWHLDKFTRANTETAEALLTGTIEDAPLMAQAHSTLAVCHVHKMLNAWCEDPAAEIAAAGEAAKRAVALDANDASAVAVMGLAALFARRFDDCIELLDRAIARNPNLANAYGFLATAYGCMGQCDRALDAYEKAVSLSPRDHTRLFWMSGRGIALYIDGRYEETVENAGTMMRIDPSYGAAHRQLCAALAMLDRLDEAEQATARLRELMPDLTIAKVATMIPVMKAADKERWLAGLRKAGLPE
jgi:adenylate cyclase